MSTQKKTTLVRQVEKIRPIVEGCQWRIDDAKRRYCFREESIPEGATEVNALWAYPYDGCHQCSWDDHHNCAFGWSFIPPEHWNEPITDFEIAVRGGDIRRGQRLYSGYMELYADEFTDEEYDAQMDKEREERWKEIERREEEEEKDRLMEEAMRFDEWWEREGKYIQQIEEDRLKYEIDSDLEDTDEECDEFSD